MIDKSSPSQEFREKYINDNRVKKWVDLALRIEGTNKTYGVHAAGVVIASDPLDELVPLQRNNEGQIITCLLYTSPSPRDKRQSRMPSSA